jgi:hypothetical protein
MHQTGGSQTFLVLALYLGVHLFLAVRLNQNIEL